MTVFTVGVFLLGFVVLTLLALLIVSQIHVWRERRELAKERALKAPHVHRWRQITEFARQCDDRTCAEIDIADGSPDGMPDYMKLMTTKQAGKNPVQEAEIYKTLDPRMLHGEGTAGKLCDECFRVYPKFCPWCPYCDPRPIPHMVIDEGTGEYVAASPETLVRLEQERRERLKRVRQAQFSADTAVSKRTLDS